MFWWLNTKKARRKMSRWSLLCYIWLIRQWSLTVAPNTWWRSERSFYFLFWRLAEWPKKNLSLYMWKTGTFRGLSVSISASVSRPSEESLIFRSGSTQFLLRAPDFLLTFKTLSSRWTRLLHRSQSRKTTLASSHRSAQVALLIFGNWPKIPTLNTSCLLFITRG